MTEQVICSETGKECLHYNEDICKEHSKCSVLDAKDFFQPLPDPRMTGSALAIDLKRNNVATISVRTKKYEEGKCEHSNVCVLWFISSTVDKETSQLRYECKDECGKVYTFPDAVVEEYAQKHLLPMPWETSQSKKD